MHNYIHYIIIKKYKLRPRNVQIGFRVAEILMENRIQPSRNRTYFVSGCTSEGWWLDSLQTKGIFLPPPPNQSKNTGSGAHLTSHPIVRVALFFGCDVF